MKQCLMDLGQNFNAGISLLNSLSDLIFIMEKRDNGIYYHFVNSSAKKILNLNDSVIGKKLIDVVPLEFAYNLQNKYEEAFECNKQVYFEEVIHLEETEFIGETALNPIKIEDGTNKYVLAIVRDVTNRRNREKNILRLNKKIEQSNVQLKKLLEKNERAYKELEMFWNFTVDPVYYFSNNQIVKVNPAFEKTFGFKEAEIINDSTAFIPKPLNFELKFIAERIEKGENVISYETKRVTKDGHLLDILASFTPVRDETGKIIGANVFCKNITDIKGAMKKLKRSEEKFRLITENAFDIIKVVNCQGLTDYITPSVEDISGYKVNDFLGQHFTQFVHPDDQAKIISEFNNLKKGLDSSKIEIRIQHREGHWIWLETTTKVVKEEDEIKQFVAIARDITERKLQRERLARMALYDYLTGLPNRRLFDERLEISIKQAKRSNKKVAVMMLDGNKFKDVNDTFGHDAGDAVLKEMASRLLTCVRESDSVARFGGDELAIVLPEIENVETVVEVAQRILNSFERPLYFKGSEIQLGVGIGIALYPDHGVDLKKVLKSADDALYQAKELNGNQFKVAP